MARPCVTLATLAALATLATATLPALLRALPAFLRSCAPTDPDESPMPPETTGLNKGGAPGHVTPPPQPAPKGTKGCLLYTSRCV